MNRPYSLHPLTHPIISNRLWNSFESSEEAREIWVLEQETSIEVDRVEQKHQNLLPFGKNGTEVKAINFVDEDEEDDEEEEDNDDDDSDSHEDDEEEEEIDMEVEGQDSPTF